MNWTIRKNHLNKNMLFEGGIQVREPSRAEKEFWARIRELESSLEIFKTTEKFVLEQYESVRRENIEAEIKIKELENENKGLKGPLFKLKDDHRTLLMALAGRDKRIAELESQVAHWKSNHDEQLKVKRQLLDRPDLQGRAASIKRLRDRINELEEKSIEDDKILEEYHVLVADLAANLPVFEGRENPLEVGHAYLIKKRLEDLETQNKALIETGHWIGQNEAHDLKVAAQEFLKNSLFAPEDFFRLKEALKACDSINSPPQFFVDNAKRFIEKVNTEFDDKIMEQISAGLSSQEDTKQLLDLFPAFTSPPKHKEPPHNHPTQTPPQESEHPPTHEG